MKTQYDLPSCGTFTAETEWMHDPRSSSPWWSCLGTFTALDGETYPCELAVELADLDGDPETDPWLSSQVASLESPPESWWHPTPPPHSESP